MEEGLRLCLCRVLGSSAKLSHIPCTGRMLDSQLFTSGWSGYGSTWTQSLAPHTGNTYTCMLGTSPFPTRPRCTSMVCVMEEIGGGKTTERKGEEEDKMIKKEDEAMMEKDEGIMNFFL